MITYENGETALPGDLVDLDGRRGVVEAVIDSEEDRASWGVDDRGIMVKIDVLGLVFQTVDSTDWPEVVLRHRSNA